MRRAPERLTSSLFDDRERRRTALLTLMPADERERISRLWRIDTLLGEVELHNLQHGPEAVPPQHLLRLTRKLGGDVEAVVSDTQSAPGAALHDLLLDLADGLMTPLGLDDE